MRLASLIEMMMHVDPAQRPPAVSVLLTAIVLLSKMGEKGGGGGDDVGITVRGLIHIGNLYCMPQQRERKLE